MTHGHSDDAKQTDDDGVNTTGKFDTYATTVGINVNPNASANALKTKTDRLTSRNSADNVTIAVSKGLLLQQNQQSQNFLQLNIHASAFAT